MLPARGEFVFDRSSSGKVKGGSESFLMHSTLISYSGLNCNAQFAGPRMWTPQSPIRPLPKS